MSEKTTPFISLGVVFGDNEGQEMHITMHDPDPIIHIMACQVDAEDVARYEFAQALQRISGYLTVKHTENFRKSQKYLQARTGKGRRGR